MSRNGEFFVIFPGDAVLLTRDQITSTLLKERLSLTAFLATVTRNYHLAEDVFQDVCVKAIGHEAGFESIAHLMNWSRLSGKNRAIDLLRVRDGKHEGLSDKLLETLSGVWPKDEAMTLRRRQDALEACLDSLTDHSRTVLRLRYFEGRRGSDVAGLLGRKIETIYQNLARIHKTLGECIQTRLLAQEEMS